MSSPPVIPIDESPTPPPATSPTQRSYVPDSQPHSESGYHGVSPSVGSNYHEDHEYHDSIHRHDSNHHHHREHEDQDDHSTAQIATPKARGAFVPPRPSTAKSASSPDILSAISQAVAFDEQSFSTPRKNGLARNGSASSGVTRSGGIGGKEVQSRSHVEKQTMGGTTGLVRRAGGSRGGSGTQLGGGSISGYEESTEVYPGLGKRKVDEEEVELQVQVNRSSQRTKIEEVEGEADEGEEVEGDDDEGEFDPTAEIIKFDAQRELVDQWDQLQKEVVPYLQDFAKITLTNAFETILAVTTMFHRLTRDTRAELESGVKKIAAEEDKQEEARAIVIQFSQEMQRVSEVLARFGGGGPIAGVNK